MTNVAVFAGCGNDRRSAAMGVRQNLNADMSQT